MHYPKPGRFGAFVLLLALVVVGVPRAGQAEQYRHTGEYLGRWNYDLPDPGTMTNIATSTVPGRSRVPQIGDVVFVADGPGRIVGRTDVGCTWRFAVTRGSLELDPPSQLCHNPTSRVAYTISRWTVAVEGAREVETIRATSHHPDGDHAFVLEKGARTKAAEHDPTAAAKFAGTWTHDPADLAAGVNARTTVRTAPDGTRTREQTPERGQVTITLDRGNRMTARTGDGCAWSLVARGNTAKLDPPIQTCTRSATTAITTRSWTVATDGTRQASVMTGTDERGGDFALGGGSLSRG
ncbi:MULTISPECIES: hypothetical protein [Saccharothrix]|uniref:hypothetical protein n=1 Tax=Saccharothrix TaxID=2071 RepID=UPI00093B53F0|nr:hypothetical protein [Saccharothrix sp. CB00851]OKI39303.1 hypothetical protein A6A25_03895 [Saccharothrix sp. CB00851]